MSGSKGFLVLKCLHILMALIVIQTIRRIPDDVRQQWFTFASAGRIALDIGRFEIMGVAIKENDVATLVVA